MVACSFHLSTAVRTILARPTWATSKAQPRRLQVLGCDFLDCFSSPCRVDHVTSIFFYSFNFFTAELLLSSFACSNSIVRRRAAALVSAPAIASQPLATSPCQLSSSETTLDRCVAVAETFIILSRYHAILASPVAIDCGLKYANLLPCRNLDRHILCTAPTTSGTTPIDRFPA
jgi:hypothetical protein